jgi:hypothetical protein
MKFLSSLLEVLGLLAVVVGAALFDYRAGLIAAGVVAVLVGLALDPPERRLE